MGAGSGHWARSPRFAFPDAWRRPAVTFSRGHAPSPALNPSAHPTSPAASRAFSSRPLLASESASAHAPVPAFTHNPRHVRPTSPKFRRVAQNATRSGCKSPVRGRFRCPVFREFPGSSPKMGHDIAATLARGRWAAGRILRNAAHGPLRHRPPRRGATLERVGIGRQRAFWRASFFGQVPKWRASP